MMMISAAAQFVLGQAEDLIGPARGLAARQAFEQADIVFLVWPDPNQVDLIPHGYAIKIGKGAVLVYEGVFEGHSVITIPCRDKEEADQFYVAFGDGKLQ